MGYNLHQNTPLKIHQNKVYNLLLNNYLYQSTISYQIQSYTSLYHSVLPTSYYILYQWGHEYQYTGQVIPFYTNINTNLPVVPFYARAYRFILHSHSSISKLWVTTSGTILYPDFIPEYFIAVPLIPLAVSNILCQSTSPFYTSPFYTSLYQASYQSYHFIPVYTH